MGICRTFESSLSDDPACDEILTMDLNEIAEFLHSAARSVGAEENSYADGVERGHEDVQIRRVVPA